MRGYLIVATFHFGLIGLTILIWPELYVSAAFVPLVRFTELQLWGVAYIFVGLLCLTAVVTRWPQFARAGMVLAFVVLIVSAAAVATGVVASWCDPNIPNSSPVIPLSFAALAVKDLLMVGRPMEPLMHDFTETRAPLDPT